MNEFILSCMVLTLVLGVSFLPFWVALCRSHRSKWAILIVTVLFGWTGIGWLAALIWAFTNPGQNVIVNNHITNNA